MSTTKDSRQGGSWLLHETDPADVFTPERMTEEHRLIARTTDEFIDTEVLPNLDALEAKDWVRARQIIRRSGALGLLGTNVPEQYGGLGLDKASSLIVAERVARSASFATTYGGQVNLCIVPIVLFGTATQTYGQALSDEQEILGYAADIMIDTYAAESAVLRARGQSRCARTCRPSRGGRADIRERRRPTGGTGRP